MFTLPLLTLLTFACTGPSGPEPVTPTPPVSPAPAEVEARALAKVTALLTLTRAQDWAALSATIPAEGLRVSGSSLVRLDADAVLSPAALAGAGTDHTVYRWGEHPGSGLPWEGTVAALLTETLAPFDAATTRTVNGRFDTSHSSNLEAIYPGHVWVDLHLPAGGDAPAWRSAVFVLRPAGDELLWVGLVLDRWIP